MVNVDRKKDCKGSGGGELGRLVEEGSTGGGIFPKHIVVNILLIESVHLLVPSYKHG